MRRLTRASLLAPALLALLCVTASKTYGRQTDPSSFYRITAAHSGKCLDVSGGADATGNGVPVIQWDCHDGDNQKWRFVAVGNDYYQIIAKHSGKALDVYGGVISTGDGVPVQQRDSNSSPNQLWRLSRENNGLYAIIAQHSGKALEIGGGVGATGNGAPAQQWKDVGAANQRWAVTRLPGATRAVMTRFDPVTHGFQFGNTFTNDLSGGGTSDGLCGGMMYAAMDYYLAGRRVPGIDYRPAIGTTLQTYLYNRQTTQLLSNGDRYADMIAGAGPLADKKIYFERGLKEETLRDLRRQIDAGTPVVLALQNADNMFGHSVLAIGYDMGRYRGDPGEHAEDLGIYVYDPNHPRQTRILTPDVRAQRYVYRQAGGRDAGSSASDSDAIDPHAHWLTYFVDTRYRSTAAPTIPEPDLGGPDGLVRELRLTIRTGGDELVGGNDEVEAIVNIEGRAPQVFENLNHRMRWMSFYDQTISLPLASPARIADIRGLVLKKTVRSQAGVGADIWDLDGVDLYAYGGGEPPRCLLHLSGTPLLSFNAVVTVFSANIPPARC